MAYLIHEFQSVTSSFFPSIGSSCKGRSHCAISPMLYILHGENSSPSSFLRLIKKKKIFLILGFCIRKPLVLLHLFHVPQFSLKNKDDIPVYFQTPLSTLTVQNSERKREVWILGSLQTPKLMSFWESHLSSVSALVTKRKVTNVVKFLDLPNIYWVCIVFTKCPVYVKHCPTC